MSTYILPLGIRIPNDDEYPSTYNVKEINNKRNMANIIEGYTLQKSEDQKYTHYFEINIDGDKVWDFFIAATNKIIDNIAYGIIGLREEEPKLSRFTTKENVIKAFKDYAFELTNDGFLEFGIANYDDTSLNEIFASSFKYIKIWTNKLTFLLETLSSFGIQHIENLQFIDEFPVVSEALTDKVNGVTPYTEVKEIIEQRFESFKK
ncbi:MAG: hypothetical protein K0S47_462 [Herbinix sp.]|jgi:hypothetical protein|nr:hypothetical protein [Herbinix sp.]